MSQTGSPTTKTKHILSLATYKAKSPIFNPTSFSQNFTLTQPKKQQATYHNISTILSPRHLWSTGTRTPLLSHWLYNIIYPSTPWPRPCPSRKGKDGSKAFTHKITQLLKSWRLGDNFHGKKYATQTPLQNYTITNNIQNTNTPTHHYTITPTLPYSLP